MKRTFDNSEEHGLQPISLVWKRGIGQIQLIIAIFCLALGTGVDQVRAGCSIPAWVNSAMSPQITESKVYYPNFTPNPNYSPTVTRYYKKREEAYKLEYTNKFGNNSPSETVYRKISSLETSFHDPAMCPGITSAHNGETYSYLATLEMINTPSVGVEQSGYFTAPTAGWVWEWQSGTITSFEYTYSFGMPWDWSATTYNQNSSHQHGHSEDISEGDPGWNCVFDYVRDIDLTSDTAKHTVNLEYYNIPTSWVAYDNWQVESTTTITLSEEDLTEDMLDRWKQHGSGLLDTVEFSTDRNEALITLAADEASVTGRMMRYKIELPQCDPEGTYEATWNEVAHYNDGKTDRRAMKENILGSIRFGQVHDVKIPRVIAGQAVKVSIEDLNVRIKPADNSPGSGGPGSGGSGGPGSGGSGGPGSGGFSSGGSGPSFSGGCSGCGQNSEYSFDINAGPQIEIHAGMSAYGYSGGGIYISTYPGETIKPNDVYSMIELGGGGLQEYIDSKGVKWKNVPSELATSQGTLRVSFEEGRLDAFDSRIVHVDCYRPGLDPGAPYASWRIESTKREIVAVKTNNVTGQVTDRFVYEFLGAPYAAGDTTVTVMSQANGLRTETLEVENFSGHRTETFAVFGADRIYKYYTQKVYGSIPGAAGDSEVLLSETVGSLDAAPKTTSWAYYSDRSVFGSERPVRLVTYPDQSWEYYVYDTGAGSGYNRKSRVYQSWLNSATPGTSAPDPATCRTIDYSYDSVAPDDSGKEPYTPRTVTESVKAHPIKKHFTVVTTSGRREYDCVNPAATAPSDVNDLVTKTERVGWGGWISKIERPDKTVTTFSYSVNADYPGWLFTTERSGVLNGGTII